MVHAHGGSYGAWASDIELPLWKQQGVAAVVELAGLQVSGWDCLVSSPSLPGLGTWC